MPIPKEIPLDDKTANLVGEEIKPCFVDELYKYFKKPKDINVIDCLEWEMYLLFLHLFPYNILKYSPDTYQFKIQMFANQSCVKLVLFHKTFEKHNQLFIMYCITIKFEEGKWYLKKCGHYKPKSPKSYEAQEKFNLILDFWMNDDEFH